MDKIATCVADLLAMATTVGSQDLAQAKLRVELLFTDADRQTGGHFGVAQKLRDHLGRALNMNHGPVTKQFLNELIFWLDE
jgi:hypothetical protein